MNDLSGIVGILIEQEERGDALTLDRIKKAVVDLYDSYDRIPENSAHSQFFEEPEKAEEIIKLLLKAQ